jgi:hypothetical protein
MGLVIALHGCSTREVPRLKNDEILKSCADVVEKVRTRDQFFKAIRGKASVEGMGVETDVELVITASGEVRMEFVGPLGMRLGLFLINHDWVYLYVPREKTVLRFPTQELYSNTARRARFLRLIPIPVLPEALFDSVLTRIGIPQETEVSLLACGFDPESQSYWLRLPYTANSPYKGGRWVWIEPHSFSPLKVFYFDAYLPQQSDLKSVGRPMITAEFSRHMNLGEASAFPRSILMTSSEQKSLKFDWSGIELLQSYNPKIFTWRPPASVIVKDY